MSDGGKQTVRRQKLLKSREEERLFIAHIAIGKSFISPDL